MPILVVVALAGLLLSAPALAAQAPEPSATGPALFESHDPLEVTIWADFEELEDDRDQEEEEREGRINFTTPDGTSLDLSLQIQTRGRFRLKRDTCRFPPLRINLKKGELDGTFLDGQDKIKLVTHCRDDDRYEQNVLEEYLVYRMYNVLTDNSMRVRLARMTYHDTGDEDDDPVTRWGFLLEDDDLVAERLGGEILDLEDEEMKQIHPARVVGRNTGPLVLFNYMVGNTDFSIYAAHNVELVVRENETIPVPYDFDWTGFVDAPYAHPDPRFNIRNVRQRVFRGYCRPGVDYQGLYALFNEKRDEIEEPIRTLEPLEQRNRQEALEYIADFYEIINDEQRAKSNIERACLSF